LFLLCTSKITQAQQLNEKANNVLVINHEEQALVQLKENIYIHTDKDIYEPGEDLWFKAYILNAQQLKPSTETAIVFVKLVQLTEGKNEPIVQEKYEVINGFANGHLFLNEILESGTYQLEMYTKNTLESVSQELQAVKRFQIKESIIPKILMDIEFSQKKYARNDAINAEVHVFSRSRAPYTNTVLIAELYGGTKKLSRLKARTDNEGVALLSFSAEKSKKATDIKLRVRYKGQEETSLIEIPFKNLSELQFGMYPEGGSLVASLPNTVAFKALDPNGRPVSVKGILYENGKKLRSFEATHHGMGTFRLLPKPSKNYSVQITSPKLDSIFQLPEIQQEGIKLQVNRRDQKHIHFDITRTKNSIRKKIYIRAQQRGLVYWMATASLQKERVRFKLPLDQLPQGITEVTVFDDNFLPIAERLVYTNLDQKLRISLKEISKSLFGQKDKVVATFKVEDQNRKPVVANLSLSVSDHLYVSKKNNYSMIPHYYLFSELKGHVYDAGYYFNSKNKKRAQHLDLLMLTQGWRNYVWNQEHFDQNPSKITFHPTIRGKVYRKLENGMLANPDSTIVKVSYPSYMLQLDIEKGGGFELPLSAYKMAQGSEIIFFPFEEKSTIIEIEEPFEQVAKIIKSKKHIFPLDDLPLQSKKQSSYDTKFSFTETNYLDEVNLSSFKERKKNKGTNGRFVASSNDYVCFQYGILNCVNHPYGPKPENGKTYRLNNGGIVVYYFGGIEKQKNKDRFAKVRGMYPEKEFYSPMYDKNPDDKFFPDTRKTLFWAPNLISDKNGEITVEFFTSDIQTTFLGKIEGTNGAGLLGSHLFRFEVR
jgi:5-hydroxyisourate hydrolase-like protein (transthyretin family)